MNIVKVGEREDRHSYSAINPHLVLLDHYKNGELVLLIEKDGFTEIFELGKLINENCSL